MLEIEKSNAIETAKTLHDNPFGCHSLCVFILGIAGTVTIQSHVLHKQKEKQKTIDAGESVRRLAIYGEK